MPKLQMPSSCGGERTHAEYRLLFYKDVLIYSNNGRTTARNYNKRKKPDKKKNTRYDWITHIQRFFLVN